MKKLFNSRFLFILAISIVVLIGLTLGAFYLFDDSEDSFIKSGYVLNPLSDKVERYFFDKDTNYRTNLSSMVEFNDIDENEVSVLKDSFVHYMDNSLSFLKNGAILDLDSVKGSGAVTFYNITDNSIIEKDNNGYYIETTGNTIRLNNFMGRISDNKYIIVGSVQAKIPGNDSLIKGDYFEIIYVEEGVINIENKDVKYQVAAEGTIFYVNNLVIDLGNKKISLNDEDIMSITAITIDGNENVEIIPKEPEEDKEDDKTNQNDGTGNIDSINPTIPDDGQEDGNGDGENDVPNIPNTELEEGLIVTLKDADVTSNAISVTFDVINETEKDILMLKVTNMDTGRTVDITAQVLANEPIGVKLLSPNTKYLFTVINEKDGNKYFQKVIKTNDFGVSLEKNYATDSSISYNVSIDTDTDITKVKLSLYKFNEDTGENEYVENSERTISKEDKKNYEIVYDNLDSNTIYTAILNNFETKSATFLDIYELTLTSLSLKKTPNFYNMVANKVIEDASYKLSYENIIDEDNAIISYTYYIYEYKDDIDNENTDYVKKIEKDNASSAIVYFGDDDDKLNTETPYYYQTVIKYFDNEKYVEYMPIKDRINFVMGGEPVVTVIQDEEKTSYDSITTSITITDPGCSIHMPNRENCPADDSTIFVKIIPQFPIEGANPDDYTITMYIEKEDYKIKNGEIVIEELVIPNLEEGSLYGVEVQAIRSDLGKLTSIEHSDKSQRILKTKTLSSFTAIFPDEDIQNSSANHVVNQRVKLEASENNNGTLSPEESASQIKKVIINLYEGEHTDVTNQNPIVSPKILVDGIDGDLKELFYDNYYTITTDETFGLDIEELKKRSTDGKLNKYYTIKIEAYYDVDTVNAVKISNNIKPYQILESLTWEKLLEPQIIPDPFNRDYREAGKTFNKLTNGGTTVGYKLNAVYDRVGMIANGSTPKEITIYVYDSNKKPVKFYVEDDKGGLKLVDKYTDSVEDLNVGNYLNYIYMDYGLPYGDNDDIMRRGNSYYIGYELLLENEKGNERYPSNASNNSLRDYGLFTELLTPVMKETPKIKTYISKSDETSITYWYQLTDPDNAVYRENTDKDSMFYYTVNGVDKGLLKTTTKDDNTYITIPELKNNDLYSFYYKKNLTNTGLFENDVKPTDIDSSLSAGRLFDGYYEALDKDNTGNLKYNFEFEIVNNSNNKNENKVMIKILANDDLFERILHYHVIFKDSKGNIFEKQIGYSDLSLCPMDSEDNLPRCFSVDYTDLKNKGMKSDKDNTNLITISIDAYYDNGIIGYDAVLENYKYMIFQNYNTNVSGEYITFNSLGKLGKWDGKVSKGYYTYEYNNKERTSIYYKRYENSVNSNGEKEEIIKNDANINNVTLSELGYNSDYGIINPKMVSVDKMVSSNNTFSFTSITPTVKVTTKTGLINGSVQNLTLYGVDLSDVKNEGNDKNPEYYLYINVWDNLDNALSGNNNIVRPLVKVPINKTNPNSTISAIIDGLAPVTNGEYYYFNVYAYMFKDNDYKLVQLFNESSSNEDETKTYSFNTKSGESLFNGRTINYIVDKEEYGKRYLHTEINLSAYLDHPYNFDLMYMICKDTKCTKDNGYIFKKTISNEDLISMINDKKKVIDEEDITKYDLEYNKDYYLYIYGVASLYEKSGNDFSNGEQYINMIISRDRQFKLTALREPSFVVTRKAQNDEEGHFIDFRITVNDLDKTLIDGKYHIKLTDMSGNVVGDLYEEVDGNLVLVNDYSNHDFDASEGNSHIVIRGLEANTRYSVIVYSEAYVNNYSLEIPKEERTYEVNKSHTIYTTDVYGITFGKDKDISYQVTEDSYIVSFRSATNFDNVKQVNYTIQLDTGEIDDNNEPKYQFVTDGNEVIDNDKYKFRFDDEVGYGYYVIKRTDGLKNKVGDYYLITLNFDVVDPNDSEKTVNLSSAYNSKFTALQQYLVVDDKK